MFIIQAKSKIFLQARDVYLDSSRLMHPSCSSSRQHWLIIVKLSFHTPTWSILAGIPTPICSPYFPRLWDGAFVWAAFGYYQGMALVPPRRMYEPYSITVNNSFKMKRFVTFLQLREPAATTSKWGGACASGAGSADLPDVRCISLIWLERVSLLLEFGRDVFISVTQWQSCKSRAIRDSNVKKG